MEKIIMSPPIAFLIYLLLVGVLYLLGRGLAGQSKPTPTKISTYASGEAPPGRIAAPGYRPFFTVALFFAILHLGVLVLGSSELGTSSSSPIALAYLIGLILALVVLILG